MQSYIALLALGRAAPTVPRPPMATNRCKRQPSAREKKFLSPIYMCIPWSQLSICCKAKAAARGKRREREKCFFSPSHSPRSKPRISVSYFSSSSLLLFTANIKEGRKMKYSVAKHKSLDSASSSTYNSDVYRMTVV
ncbi:hypothetical protein EYR41_003459 [Orbilia oligospora]|uniref:Uncharacterized protein n=1 Tax=Orbilia oligospora TaxID=2813651 RepID=A0A8H2E314_ORBOL|nr:hypothetical protein TWF132_001005 [Orbilia oligospora]TGJ71497.1 hypothetical protein EYR41_003459 [Orbilia oligospora]